MNAKLMYIKKSLACIASFNAISDKGDEKECDKITCPSCKIALKNVMKVKLVCQITVIHRQSQQKCPSLDNMDIAEVNTACWQTANGCRRISKVDIPGFACFLRTLFVPHKCDIIVEGPTANPC